MLEAGPLDRDPLATTSSNDEIVTVELAVVAVVRDNLAGACRVEGQRAGVESESSVGAAEMRERM